MNAARIKRMTRTASQMGPVATKPVFMVSDKAKLKPVSTATETS